MKRHHIVLFGLVAAIALALVLWPREADTPTKTDVSSTFDPDLPQGQDTYVHGEERGGGTVQAPSDAGPREGVVQLPPELRGAINPKVAIGQAMKDESESAKVSPPPLPEADRKAAEMNKDPRMTAYKDGIRNAIRGITPAVKDCYEQQLKQDPTIAGSIRITFEIKAVDGGGRVTSGEVPESEIRSPFFEACVLEKVGNAEFPEPLEGGTVKVTYPFHFDPGGGFGGKQPESQPQDGIHSK